MRPNWLIVPMLALCVSPAQAHSVFGETASFWSGVAHVGTSPLAMAILLGLASRNAAQPASAAYSSIAAVIVSCGLAAAAMTSTVLGPLAATVIGGLAAVSPRRLPYESLPLGGLAGAAIGTAIALDAPNWIACLGAAAAAGYLSMMAFEGLTRLERFSPIPRRVIGSWVAALGLLLVALSLRA